MGEWKEYELGKILAPKGYIRGPFGSALRRDELLESGIPVYEQQHAIYGSRKFRYFINDEKFQTLHRFQIQPNDLIISCSGTIGRVSIIKDHDPIGIISQALLILRPNRNIVLPEFLKYFFISSLGYNALVERSSGSVQVNINKREVIEKIKLFLPALAEQRKIVDLLSSLDEKIETNRKISARLEELAQALFKSWFIDFEPFGGEMPEDWEVKSLSNIANYMNGLAMQKFPPLSEEDKLPVLKIKELGEGKLSTNSDWCSKSQIGASYVINKGDIIFSWSGTLLVKMWTGEKCGLNQHLFKVTSDNFPKWFYYYWTLYHNEKFKRIAKDKAVTMGHIKREELDKAKVVIPPKDIMETVNSIMKCILDKVLSTSLEADRLVELRDSLLPKLMSGEIKVE